jgi:hypothetical protein
MATKRVKKPRKAAQPRKKKTGQPYEDAIRNVIRVLKDELGLASVSDDNGDIAGTVEKWQIDVAAYQKGDQKLVVFECKDRGRNLEKSQAAAFAVTIEDLGAAKGYLVTQKMLSKGAKNVAAWKGIEHMRVEWDDSTNQAIIDFLGRTFIQRGLGLIIVGGAPDKAGNSSVQ